MGADLSRYIVNPGPKSAVGGLRAAVTTDSAIVTEVMVDVLRRGGNAVDAAIAGSLVQTAVEPYMTNLAGLVSVLYYEASSGRIHQLDSQGAFPSGLPPFRPVPVGAGPYAALPPSAIIPGFMPGMKALHARWATRPWHELCEPAVQWAERGHPVSSFEYGANVFAEKFITYFPEGRDFFQPRGYFPSVGEVFVPPGMAATLRAVADQGPDYMITGAWAETFVARGNELGWGVRLEHMTETPPRWIEPVRFRHHDHEIVSLGPPQAQGTFLAVVMGILRHLGIGDMQPGSAEHLWAMGNALRHGARHWEFVQDDTIYEVPIDVLLDDAYHAQLARLIRRSRPRIDLSGHIRLADDAAGGSDFMSTVMGGGGRPRRGASEPYQPTGSCEIAVADAAGNWVQMMNTLQGSGIPGMVISGVPMVGSHATFGFLASPIDGTLVPRAKLRGVVGNTLVLRAGRPVLSAGSPGNVHCTVPQVLTYALDFGMDPYAAVDAPRMLPMSEGRAIVVEDRLRPGVVEQLYRLGVRVAMTPGYDSHMGSFSVLARDEKTGCYTAVADPRRCAVAGGIRE